MPAEVEVRVLPNWRTEFKEPLTPDAPLEQRRRYIMLRWSELRLELESIRQESRFGRIDNPEDPPEKQVRRPLKSEEIRSLHVAQQSCESEMALLKEEQKYLRVVLLDPDAGDTPMADVDRMMAVAMERVLMQVDQPKERVK